MKYEVLKRLINEWMESERDNFETAKRLGGIDSCGACMASGAIFAYTQILKDIEDLESEAVLS